MDNQILKETFRVDPLKGPENYYTWKLIMEDILTASDLWEYTTGAMKQPNASAPAADKLAWQKKDHQALIAIHLWIASEMLVYIMEAKTASEARGSLKWAFESSSVIGHIALKWHFLHMKCNDGDDIEMHICKIHGYSAKLSNIGYLLTNEDLSTTILTSLPDSWSSLIQAIDPSIFTTRA